MNTTDIRRTELPPRARRIRFATYGGRKLWGTTSACAENTQSSNRCQGTTWNYLRVRGEYKALIAPLQSPQELPPRARRIPSGIPDQPQQIGTTSACAENTRITDPTSCIMRNYLRVRGEYNPARSTSQSEMELPPRARRIQIDSVFEVALPGTTSACAENTAQHR